MRVEVFHYYLVSLLEFTYAYPGPLTERQEGVGSYGVLVLRSEPLRVKLLGVGEVLWVSVYRPKRYENPVASFHSYTIWEGEGRHAASSKEHQSRVLPHCLC